MNSDIWNPVIKNVGAKLVKNMHLWFFKLFFYCKMQFLIADSTIVISVIYEKKYQACHSILWEEDGSLEFTSHGKYDATETCY